MVGNLLRILDVVSLGRFEGKTFEQYATPFREGVINSSEIPILTKDTGDFYDAFFIMPFVLCLFYKVSFFCFNPIINTGSSYPKVRGIYEIIVKKLRLFQKLAVFLS